MLHNMLQGIGRNLYNTVHGSGRDCKAQLNTCTEVLWKVTYAAVGELRDILLKQYTAVIRNSMAAMILFYVMKKDW